MSATPYVSSSMTTTPGCPATWNLSSPPWRPTRGQPSHTARPNWHRRIWSHSPTFRPVQPTSCTAWTPSVCTSASPRSAWCSSRRSALLEIGGFDSNMTFAEDGDLLLRIGARYPGVGIDSVGMLHRVRSPSRARSDYYWSGRSFATGGQRNLVSVGRITSGTPRKQVQFVLLFCEDFLSCATHRRRREAILCMSRALWMSPPHTLLRIPIFWLGLRQLVGASVRERAWWDRSGLPA